MADDLAAREVHWLIQLRDETPASSPRILGFLWPSFRSRPRPLSRCTARADGGLGHDLDTSRRIAFWIDLEQWLGWLKPLADGL